MKRDFASGAIVYSRSSLSWDILRNQHYPFHKEPKKGHHQLCHLIDCNLVLLFTSVIFGGPSTYTMWGIVLGFVLQVIEESHRISLSILSYGFSIGDQ